VSDPHGIWAGVIGHPVKHSLSPLIHGAWLKAAGIEGLYAPIEASPDGFEAMVRAKIAEGYAGLNVTVPFKTQALELAETATFRALDAGAANLLTFRGGRIHADNTDGVGLLAAFAEQAPQWQAHAAPVTILGAGGAARGAAVALEDAGCPQIRIVNRTAEKAEVLAQALGGAVVAMTGREAFEGVGAVINATSAGLLGGELEAPLDATPEGCVVMDMTYVPVLTAFLAHAEGLGRPVVDGLSMLIGQAKPSFQAFFGQPPPDTDVRSLAIAELARR
jgi:shikimate dehydrogenase